MRDFVRGEDLDRGTIVSCESLSDDDRLVGTTNAKVREGADGVPDDPVIPSDPFDGNRVEEVRCLAYEEVLRGEQKGVAVVLGSDEEELVVKVSLGVIGIRVDGAMEFDDPVVHCLVHASLEDEADLGCDECACVPMASEGYRRVEVVVHGCVRRVLIVTSDGSRV